MLTVSGVKKAGYLITISFIERAVREKTFWLTILSIGAAVGLKISLLIGGRIPFNSDEAVVALMARHILNGARPLFFYGQAYMGSLDAWLIAAGFALFGTQVWVVRLIQILLYALTMASTAWLGRLVFGTWKAGMVAVWLLTVPSVNVTLYSTASLGGYGEALLLGNLILIVGLLLLAWWVQSQTFPIIASFLFGALIGLGFWVNGLTLVYSVAVMFYIGISAWRYDKINPEQAKSWRKLVFPGLAMISGLLAGSSPWWVYTIQEGIGNSIQELGGSAIAGVEGLTWLAQTVQHLISFLLLGISVIVGIRPPWDIQWLVLPAIPIILFFWIAVIVNSFRRTDDRPRGHPRELLLGVILTTIAGFVLTPFGADPSGRYFLPLAVPMALLAADFLLAIAVRIGKWAWVLASFVILYNLAGTWQTAARLPPGITTQFDAVSRIDQRQMPALIRFMKDRGENFGYSNYWVSYPLAFLSQERLIFIPALPYHQDFRYTTRDNRYQPYNTAVAHSNKIAYITTNHPALDQYIRQQFKRAGVAWKEARIGDFQVFYSLSSPVKPEEIGLGVTRP